MQFGSGIEIHLTEPLGQKHGRSPARPPSSKSFEDVLNSKWHRDLHLNVHHLNHVIISRSTKSYKVKDVGPSILNSYMISTPNSYGHCQPGWSGRMRSKGFYSAAFLGANLLSVWVTSKTGLGYSNAEEDEHTTMKCIKIRRMVSICCNVDVCSRIGEKKKGCTFYL